MTPVAKRILFLLLGLLLLILAICMIPSVRSRLVEIARSVISPAIPGKDNFEDAEVISGLSGVILRSNAGAGTQAGEPNHRGLPPCKSIWFQWTASADAGITFSTEKSRTQTVLAVYESPTLEGIAKSERILINPQKSVSKFVFNAKKGRNYRIVVNGRNCGSGRSQISRSARQNIGTAEYSPYKAFYASVENQDASESDTIQVEWEALLQNGNPASYKIISIVGFVRYLESQNCRPLSGVTLTYKPCAVNPTNCINHPCTSDPELCDFLTASDGRYEFVNFRPVDDFTITPVRGGYSFLPEYQSKYCNNTADPCGWIPPSCKYLRTATGNLFQMDYRATATVSPTLTVSP